jgi:hypothetical protein
MTPPHISPETQNELDMSWVSYIEGDYKSLRQTFSKYTKSLHPHYEWVYPTDVELELAQYCRSYHYPELENVPSNIRKEFGVMVGWYQLFSYKMLFGSPYYFTWGDAVSTMLSTTFSLNVDIEQVAYSRSNQYDSSKKEVAEKLGAPYISVEDRIANWPQLKNLSGLSIPSKMLFLRIIRYLRNNLAIIQGIVPYSIPFYRQAIIELAENNIIDPNPGMDSLLMLATVKDLKQFAFDRGFKHTGPKHQLADRIQDQVDLSEITEFIRPKMVGDYIQLLLPRMPELKKFIYREMDRLDPYIKWISDSCLGIVGDKSEDRPEEIPDSQDEQINHLEPWWNKKDNPLNYLKEKWSKTEIKIIRELLWDKECDAILPDLVDRYAWDAPFYILDAIKKVVSTEKLDVFQKEIAKNKTRVWYNVIQNYGEVRTAELGIKTRKPKQMKCKNCGVKLSEWSIPPGTANEVDYNINFCRPCYEKAFYSYNKNGPDSSDQEMCNQLADLAIALEVIPTATYMLRPKVSGLSEEKQITVVKSLISLSPYDMYIERFGSWLQALTSAGIIDANALPGARGTRCIAKDGHECNSLAEKSIDDWLSDHSIPHDKEPIYPHHPKLNPSGRMRADWKVNDILIEYAGLLDDPEYKAKIETKKELAKEFNTEVIFIEPKDIFDIDKILGFLSP